MAGPFPALAQRAVEPSVRFQAVRSSRLAEVPQPNVIVPTRHLLRHTRHRPDFVTTLGVVGTPAVRMSKVYPYLLQGMEITLPNQVWATDITYIPMSRSFLYLVLPGKVRRSPEAP